MRERYGRVSFAYSGTRRGSGAEWWVDAMNNADGVRETGVVAWTHHRSLANSTLQKRTRSTREINFTCHKYCMMFLHLRPLLRTRPATRDAKDRARNIKTWSTPLPRFSFLTASPPKQSRDRGTDIYSRRQKSEDKICSCFYIRQCLRSTGTLAIISYSFFFIPSRNISRNLFVWVRVLSKFTGSWLKLFLVVLYWELSKMKIDEDSLREQRSSSLKAVGHNSCARACDVRTRKGIRQLDMSGKC